MVREARLLALHRISFETCHDVHRLIEELKLDIVLLCGGLRECYTLYHISVPGILAGVNTLGDDIYEIRALKKRGAYVAGRWLCHNIKNSRLCIGGIDALNHSQNLKRLIANPPEKPDLIIVLSYYPPRESPCSAIELATGHRVRLGIAKLVDEIRRAVDGVPMLVISCHPRLRALCVEEEHNYIHVTLGATPIALLEISIDEGEVVLRELRAVEV